MPWCCDMSCSAVRGGRVPGHEPHFSFAFLRSVLLSPEELQVMILAIAIELELAVADQRGDLSDKP
jgi:hypothetical protein